MRSRIFVAVLLLLAGISVAEERKRSNDTPSVTLHSTITGNHEQPKVLYIVPWEGPSGPDDLDTGLQPIISDVFAPIDRREFQRELQYREATATRETAR